MSTALIVWLDQCNITTKDILHNLEMGLANDAATLEMGPGNDAARLRTASVSQDHRKCLRTASVRQDQRQYLEMGLANDAATSPSAPSPLRGEGRGEASVRQDPRQYKEAGQRGRYNHEQQL